MSKSNTGTILNTRVSYKAKQALMKKAEELNTSKEFDEKITVSHLIKVAINEMWGIDCDDYDEA